MANPDDDEETSLARWRRFVELDPEAGLREAGLSEGSIESILNRANTLEFRPRKNKLGDIEDWAAFVLAILGRGTSPCTRISWATTSSTRNRRGGSRAGQLLGSNEVRALCFNLSSNSTIETLEISKDDELYRRLNPEFFTLLSYTLRRNYTLTSLTLSDLGVDDGGVRLLLLGPREGSAWQSIPSKLKEELAIEVGKNPQDFETILELKRAIASEAETLQIGGLQVNTTITRLDLSVNHISDEGIGYVAEFLQTNFTLKKFDIQVIFGFGLLAAIRLADALRQNNTLEDFAFSCQGLGDDVIQCLLEPFSGNVELGYGSPTPSEGHKTLQ